MKATRTVHLYVPEIVRATGGVQAFSRALLQAAVEILGAEKIALFSRNDTTPALRKAFPELGRVGGAGQRGGPVATAAFLAETARQAARERPAALLSTHLHLSPALVLAKSLCRAKTFAVAHGIEAWPKPTGLRGAALRRLDHLAAVSAFTAEALRGHGLPREGEVFLLPNTFDPSRFPLQTDKPAFLLERYGLRAEQPVLLTVARLAPTEGFKGYDRVIESLPRVRESFPDVVYILAGKGGDVPRLQEKVTALGLRENVLLPGFVPDDELAAHYALCDGFVMPSRKEGFGIVFLEAMACGRPVLAGNRDGSVDPLCGGELGLLVDPEDDAAIAAGIVRLLRREGPDPRVFDAPFLATEVRRRFGPEAFRARLRDWLSPALTL